MFLEGKNELLPIHKELENIVENTKGLAIHPKFLQQPNMLSFLGGNMVCYIADKDSPLFLFMEDGTFMDENYNEYDIDVPVYMCKSQRELIKIWRPTQDFQQLLADYEVRGLRDVYIEEIYYTPHEKVYLCYTREERKIIHAIKWDDGKTHLLSKDRIKLLNNRL